MARPLLGEILLESQEITQDQLNKAIEIQKKEGKVAGVSLKDGTTYHSPIVVNVAGPHSFIINRMAGVEAGMNIKTRALRQEVAHVPAPEGVDYEADGCFLSDVFLQRTSGALPSEPLRLDSPRGYEHCRNTQFCRHDDSE